MIGSHFRYRPNVYIIKIPSQKLGTVIPMFASVVITLSSHLPRLTAAMIPAGRVYDLLDYRLYKWPGHGLPTDAEGIQFVEGEYMKADEYDALISNPSDFWMRVFMPRIFGAFESWITFSPFTNIIEAPTGFFMPFMKPEVQASMQTLIDVGNELAKHTKIMSEFSRKTLEAGYPAPRGGFAKAPFDVIGDTLRGTQGIIMDMYRRPDKLHEAIDVITDLMIESVITSVNASNGISAMFPLHKGADGWMSEKQFDTFYWPSLKKVIDALIDEGILGEGSERNRGVWVRSTGDFNKTFLAYMHELCHVFEADHCARRDCLMYPFYSPRPMENDTPSTARTQL